VFSEGDVVDIDNISVATDKSSKSMTRALSNSPTGSLSAAELSWHELLNQITDVVSAMCPEDEALHTL
jgi:hypothetical protein